MATYEEKENAKEEVIQGALKLLYRQKNAVLFFCLFFHPVFFCPFVLLFPESNWHHWCVAVGIAGKQIIVENSYVKTRNKFNCGRCQTICVV